MTHVVIPVEDRRINRSIGYAIESIRKHTDYTPVTIGRDLGLCDHITTRQGRDKFANTDNAMRTACQTAWISDPFIWSNDDIYWLKPAEPIRWAIGKLETASDHNIYGQRKRKTADYLKPAGFETYDYESHTPIPISTTPMLETLEAIQSNPLLEKRSVYANRIGPPDLVAADVKLRRRCDPTPTAAWVSTAANPTTYQNLAPLLGGRG